MSEPENPREIWASDNGNYTLTQLPTKYFKDHQIRYVRGDIADGLLDALQEMVNQLASVRMSKTEHWSNEKINMTSAALLMAGKAIGRAIGVDKP